MSDHQAYQHPTDTSARDAHEAQILSRGERNPVIDRTGSHASHQTQQPAPRSTTNWSSGEKLSYQHRRNYSEQGEPEIEGSIRSHAPMRVTTRSQKDPLTGVESSTASVSSPFGESIETGEHAAGETVDLSAIDTSRLADKVADEGGLAIRDLSALQSAGIPEEFASEVADVIAGRETRTPSEVPQQFSPFVEEFWSTGTVSEKSLTKLEAMGISRNLVQRMMRGRAKISAKNDSVEIHHPDAVAASYQRLEQRHRSR